MGIAQDRLARLLNENWGPTLRGLGLTGSGRIWIIPDPTDWAMLGFQTSTPSTGAEAKFTINLLVVGKDAWEAARTEKGYYTKRPTPNAIATHRYVQRSGVLTHGADFWWRLAGDGSNEESIATEVTSALRDVIVPKLRQEMADKSPGPRGTFERVRKG